MTPVVAAVALSSFSATVGCGAFILGAISKRSACCVMSGLVSALSLCAAVIFAAGALEIATGCALP
jgi:hypothetical protein